MPGHTVLSFSYVVAHLILTTLQVNYLLIFSQVKKQLNNLAKVTKLTQVVHTHNHGLKEAHMKQKFLRTCWREKGKNINGANILSLFVCEYWYP